jgi:hypothetical protein
MDFRPLKTPGKICFPRIGYINRFCVLQHIVVIASPSARCTIPFVNPYFSHLLAPSLLLCVTDLHYPRTRILAKLARIEAV